MSSFDQSARAAAHLAIAQRENFERADHLFARLMMLQWLAGVGAALLLSPRTWAGAQSYLHPHVSAALFLGGAITIFPVYLANRYPGKVWTRHAIAIAQLLMSSLFVHLSGGRIETHFHIFGSLAFLAFYRDWRVLLTATAVAGVDHFVRGAFWPQTVYGVLTVSNWRTLEHVGWVLFEDIVLCISIGQCNREMAQVADRRAALERAEEDLRRAHSSLEQRVERRTAQLAQANGSLQESEKRYRSLFEANPLPMWIYDLETLSFLEVNDAAMSHYGYQREEFLSMTIADIRPAADQEALLAYVAAERPVDNAGIWRHQKKDGSVIDVEITTHAFEHRERPAKLVLALDVTERRRTDAERQVISEIVQGVLTTSSLDELLDLAHRSIGKFLYAKNCFVALHDPTTDLLHFEFWVDQLDPIPPPLPVGEGFSSYVLRTGKSLRLSEELKARMLEEGKFTKSGSNSASWLGVPLRTSARTIGVLAVQHYEKKNAYSERDLEFLSTMGDQIALAIERKRAADLLKRSEQGLAAAQRMAHVGNWETDLATAAVTWSEETYRIFEIAPAGFNPTHEAFLEFVHPDDREVVTTAFSESLHQSGIHTIEHRLLMPDGRVKFVEERWEAFSDHTGKPLRAAGTCQDITVAKQAEMTLRAREELLRRVMDSSQDCIKILDLEGRLLWMNEGGKDIMEIDDFASVQNLMWCDLWPADEKAAARAALALAKISQVGRFTGFCPTAKGTPRWWEVVVTPVLNDQGSPEKILSVSRDITVRRQAELELVRAKEAAEEATRAKSEFLANMSHEIRTPMNGVIGMTGLLMDTPLNEEQREFAETIHTSGEALLSIINDILDFSKIEAGKLELEVVDIDVAHVIRGTISLLQTQAKAKGLELRATIDPDVPTFLRGDAGRLRQVLINLIGNGLKFTASGHISIHVSLDHQDDSVAGLRVRVTDTGIGISEDALRRLFRAFMQADGSTTRRYGGTGLGLAISKQLVAKMGGEIGVESSPGKGSTFWFTVQLPKQLNATDARTPVNEVSALPHDPLVASAAENLQRGRVLIAEDNVVNQRVAVAQLKSLGYFADVAANGVEVLEALGRVPYEIVLMDCQMPELDGYATTRRIRERDGHQPYIIAMTANAMEGDREVCLAAGMDGYISKPVRAAELKAALQKASKETEQSISASALANLNGLATAGDPDIVAELATLFAESTSSLITKARRALQDPAQLRIIAHTLKGSCSNFGATRMETLCHQLENLDGEDAPERARVLLLAIDRESAKVQDALDDFCAAASLVNA